MQRFYKFALTVFILLFSAHQSAAQEDVARPAPEIASEIRKLSPAVRAQEFMAVAAHPLAAQAGLNILTSGGNAADAAIAMQAVLGLVEPQSSGLGGGGFLLYYDADTKALTALDGRETAPSAAKPDIFLDDQGDPVSFYDAALSGRSIGVPGTPALMWELHQRFGAMDWPALLAPGIAIAEKGFPISSRLYKSLLADKTRLTRDPLATAYFYQEDGNPKPVGHTLENPEYADTLRSLAALGPTPFYEGPIAENIVTAVRNDPNVPGSMTREDLKSYAVIERNPVCAPYRSYRICGMGEPSSGGLTSLMILGMIERFPVPEWKDNKIQAWHVYLEASKLAFADRNRYMADPDYVTTPGTRLLDPEYLDHRSRMIRLDGVMDKPAPGIPPHWPPEDDMADDTSPEGKGTTHIIAIDREGNIVTWTSTIESAFGARRMTPDGYLLNNELTDFSFRPEKDGRKVLNRVQGGKRPRSSMAPTLVFGGDGEPVAAIGSAGGSRIIGYVTQRLIAMLDWNMDLREAVSMPSLLSRGQGAEIEKGAEDVASELEEMGHKVRMDTMTSGLTAIRIQNSDAIDGAADPRREGVALGH